MALTVCISFPLSFFFFLVFGGGSSCEFVNGQAKMKITLQKGDASAARRALTSSPDSSRGRALAEPEPEPDSTKKRYVSNTGATWFLWAYHPTDATLLKAHSAKGPISFDVNGGGAGKFFCGVYLTSMDVFIYYFYS